MKKVDNHYLDCILVIHELRVNNETTANFYLWYVHNPNIFSYR